MLTITEGNGQKTPLMEENLKRFKSFQERNNKKIVEGTAAQYGLTNWQSIFDMKRDDFSISQFREASYTLARRMKEANAELAFGQLLRAGVQNTFNNIYQAVEVVYPALVREVTSNKRQEFYAPLERAGFPKRVERQGQFPETSFKGLDIEMINLKWGQMLAIERELIDDDMTGQIMQRVSDMSENQRIFEEAYVMARLFNLASSLDGEPLPVSATYSTVYSTAGIHTGGYGINATTAARLSQTQIQNGWILAKKMTDQSGRPIVVTPKVLAVSPQDVFYAEVLLGSDQNPSMSSTATGDIGKVGGIAGKNPIKALVGVLASRFIPNYGALLVDPGKGFAFQRRDATEIVQENPQSGPAFQQEVFRYRIRSRWEADFIDPKFMVNLNTSFAST